MWSIEEFRIAVLIGAVGFMTLTAVACIIANKIQGRGSK